MKIRNPSTIVSITVEINAGYNLVIRDKIKVLNEYLFFSIEEVIIPVMRNPEITKKTSTPT